MSRIIFIFLLINAFYESIYCVCTRDVIWQSNFCPLNMSLNGAILPPDDATCRFQAGDTLSLINSDANRTENIYQVRTREDWENCNATNAFNSMPRLVNDSNTVQLVTGNFFTFNIGEIIYLISTSNGSEDSANNDIIGTSPCLRMSFLLVPPTSECTLLPACNDSVLGANSNVLNVGCNSGITSLPTVTSTSVMPLSTSTMTDTITSSIMSSTVSSTVFVPTSTPSTTTTPTPSISTNSSTQNDDCFISSLGSDYCFLGYLGIIVGFVALGLVIILIILLIVAICYLIQKICYKDKSKVSPDAENTFYGDRNICARSNSESGTQLINNGTNDQTEQNPLYQPPNDPPKDPDKTPTDSIYYETTN